MKESKNLPEPLEFIRAIHEAGVKYLLIGRQAVIAYGGPMQSMDYDIYIDGSEENTRLLLKIAKKFDLIPSVSLKDIRKRFMFKLEDGFTVDVFRAKSVSSSRTGRLTFVEIYSRRKTAKDISGLEINLPAIDDLIALKKMRSSGKDLEDIAYLERIKNKG